MSVRTTLALALCAGLGLSGGALAQSVGAPAGQPSVTAPGGTEGTAGPANERRAIERGDAIPAPPGIGVPVEAPPPPPEERRLPPPPPRP
ncbi:hypothetical protein ASG52_17490 [Methylobacterium sp. Leaf456]|uniref:hypothetical protein n=1 Tax=Methylobacterium sp. Leaf456 TaxID=1736382 RepID=UPI0006F7D449|nr:hypothetical protein [Methylobacterium sp. Leaf456]KQT61029.1 hypothetical protein ASG52_17490 [Methylobacterium sp. Leaf456]